MSVATIAAWSAFWSYILFGVFKYIPTNQDKQTNVLRIPLELEEWVRLAAGRRGFQFFFVWNE